jgi:hypothetical protein
MRRIKKIEEFDGEYVIKVALFLENEFSASSKYRLGELLTHNTQKHINFTCLNRRIDYNDNLYLSGIILQKHPLFSLIQIPIKLLLLIAMLFETTYRIWQLRKFDIVLLSRTIFPKLFIFEIFFPWKKVIYDVDDAIFKIGYLERIKFEYAVKKSICTTAGNFYLYKVAKLYSKNVVLLPTCYSAKNIFLDSPDGQKKKNVVLGWVGSPSGIKYIEKILPVIENVSKTHGVTLTLVCSQIPEYLKTKNFVNYQKWDKYDDQKNFQKFDIGLMPIEKTPWELGKCGFKIIQYLAYRKPVIFTNFGFNKIFSKKIFGLYEVNNQCNEQWEAKIIAAVEDWKGASEETYLSLEAFQKTYFSYNLFYNTYVYLIKKYNQGFLSTEFEDRFEKNLPWNSLKEKKS